jgi:hypothetical protein
MEAILFLIAGNTSSNDYLKITFYGLGVLIGISDLIDLIK